METRTSEPCNGRSLQVVSLPMRDGNRYIIIIERAKTKVVSLPMRDGNGGKSRKRGQVSKVVSLPMRDGNLNRSGVGGSFITGC